ncbi:MAG: riboflavin kinase [bacterium]
MISATVGIYDGVHLGHVRILRELQKNLGRHIVFLFFKNPKKGDNILTNLKERKEILSSSGVEVINLDIKKFWRMAAYDFLDKFLVRKYGVGNLIAGDDFVFGHRRRGTISDLRKWTKEKNINFKVVPGVKLKNKKISTSLIKECLEKNALDTANKMLGRCYAVTGRKIKGLGIAGSLGFPTINLKPEKHKILPEGVFFVKSACVSGDFFALANVGSSPTFGLKNVFELYALPGYSPKIFRCRNFNVSFLKFIRKQKKFKTKKHLAARINKDVKLACKFSLNFVKNAGSKRRRK